jgi:hypothetical protein
VGTDTRFSLDNRGAGNHTLQVRAVNKSGAGAASPGETVFLNTRPSPPQAALCRSIGTGPGGSDHFGIRWAGQSQFGHSMRVGSANNSFNDVASGSQSMGQVLTLSWAQSRTAADNNARYWAIFDGVAYPDQRMGDIPSC